MSKCMSFTANTFTWQSELALHKAHIEISYLHPWLTSSSNSTIITLMPISEKLVRGNHIVWKAQILAAL
jgi:hypothetical protein